MKKIKHINFLCYYVYKTQKNPFKNMNIDKNREMMIENQLRPNKITNINIT